MLIMKESPSQVLNRTPIKSDKSYTTNNKGVIKNLLKWPHKKLADTLLDKKLKKLQKDHILEILTFMAQIFTQIFALS